MRQRPFSMRLIFDGEKRSFFPASCCVIRSRSRMRRKHPADLPHARVGFAWLTHRKSPLGYV